MRPAVDEEDEEKLTRSIVEYEDFIVSLIANKTAEQVDRTELDQERLDHAGHFRRAVKMFGKLDSDELGQNYLKACAEGSPDAAEYEREVEYREKYRHRPYFNFEYAPGELDDSGEYDGRDDAAIAEIADGMRNKRKVEEKAEEAEEDVQVEDPLGEDELAAYGKLI